MIERLKRIIYNLRHVENYVPIMTLVYCRYLLPDKLYIKLKYKAKIGYYPNLKQPKSFNEKINWLKLNDRNPKYTMLVDKYKVKQYVAGLIGDEHVIPLLGVWKSFDDIDFSKLPEQFVLKCNHDSGNFFICTDKRKFDYVRAKKMLERSLKRNYYYFSREWPYKNIEKCIIAEKFMKDEKSETLNDYKLFCCNGKVKALFIATDRGIDTRFDFFDSEFNHLPLTQGHPLADITPQKPVSFEEMKRFAEILSKDIPLVRVDFYEINGAVYFGEFTFSHYGGFTRFNPDEWDYRFGEYVDLPQ